MLFHRAYWRVLCCDKDNDIPEVGRIPPRDRRFHIYAFAFFIGIPDKNREGETYLPPSAGVMLFFTGFLTGDEWPMTALFFAPAGALVWAGESLVLAPVWDTLCLPVDFYRRDEYLKKDIWQ